MASVRMHLFPDPVLRKFCSVVRRYDKELTKIIRDMQEVIKEQPHGIGIAAPQIGINKRVAIVDVSNRVKSAKPLILVNPEILKREVKILSREGCMSIPEYTANIQRYDRIELVWHDETGVERQSWFKGIEARCIQHEVDHLNGTVILDRVSRLKTDMIPRKIDFKKL